MYDTLLTSSLPNNSVLVLPWHQHTAVLDLKAYCCLATSIVGWTLWQQLNNYGITWGSCDHNGLLHHLIKCSWFVLSVQPVQPRDDPMNTLSLRTGHGSAPAHPHTDHHMSKIDGPSPNQLCVPITNTITIDQFTELVAMYDVHCGIHECCHGDYL